MAVWLSIWSVGVFFLVSRAFLLWRSFLSGTGGKVASLGQAVFLTLFALPFLAGEVIGLVVLALATSVATILILVAIALLNYLFHFLLKAPTHAGRILLDRIEGFKIYLSATDKDRLERLQPVENSPEHFEKYLPYAVALDVERAWAEKFSDVLTRAGRGGEYSPNGYSGTAWATLHRLSAVRFQAPSPLLPRPLEGARTMDNGDWAGTRPAPTPDRFST